MAAYDRKFLVLTEATEDVMVVHEYDLRTNKWIIIQGLSNCNDEEFFQLRPSSVIGLNNLIGMKHKLPQMQPQTSTLINRLSLFLVDMFPPPKKNLRYLFIILASLVLISKYKLTPLDNFLSSLSLFLICLIFLPEQHQTICEGFSKRYIYTS